MWRVGVHSIGHVDSNSRSQALKPPKSLSSHSHHTIASPLLGLAPLKFILDFSKKNSGFLKDGFVSL